MPRSPPDVDALIGRALANRPEIVAMRDRVQAAHASALAASWARLPTVNAMGAYSHQTGQGVFAEPDTAYVGATLDWNVWSWGKAAAGARVARANAEQVEHQLEALQANVRQDVRTRTQSLTTALAGAQVAAITVEQAEENHRIQEKRLGVGGGTMQELLDADLALEKARSTRATAIFDAHRAAAALERAVGGDPWTE
jgi:outer membrane protein TolC